MFKQKLKFKNSKGMNLSAIYEGENRDAPLVVTCHGFESSKEGVGSKNLAQKLVEKGISVFRFDFTGRGQSEGNTDDLTPLQGLDDLKSAVKSLKHKQFGLYGSSFGGNVALLYASQNPVLALALKAPVSDYLWVIDKEISQRRKFWAKELKNLDIYKNAGNIKAPTLIVHGDADKVVPIEQSRKLLELLGGKKTLEVLSSVGHIINDEDLEKTNSLIADFVNKNLLY
ncbi:hypothetical protein A2165_02210 [Candidatus Curtissbacteria bacterium RBG_13_40_7]|uniref:Serine aminopeptidase S33 domain-containing protein n=1 Tax=Candidatus Curtissbacteria bacterium RBG_13_40_7 TaxID=1797706 RepID=A0A1F5FYE8_9BACT|nr:MAG: hypothetical protein A2165_02210 [Candidatus Curtissbacteria bacterium RBG_13_40_7]